MSMQWYCYWATDRIRVQLESYFKGYYDLLTKPYCDVCSSPGYSKNFCTAHDDMYNFEKIYALGEFTPKEPYSFLSGHIYGLKNQGWYQESLGNALGLLLKNKYTNLLHLDYVVPVPSHEEKRKKKGFNQVDLLIESLQNHITMKKLDCLTQIKNVEMRDLTRAQRFIAVIDMFDFKQEFSNEISGQQILLIDDVVTTGATVSECSKVLTSNGAKSVNVLAIGRTKWDINE